MCDNNNIEKKLVDDIIEMAKESVVSVLDSYWGSEFGYEVDTLDDYLEECALPESVIKYVKENNEDADFIEELFNDALDRNEVPAYQLAMANVVICNYAEPHRYMTFNYEFFKGDINGELRGLACAYDMTERELIYANGKGWNDVQVYGNNLGKEWFEKYLSEIEEEHNNVGVVNLAKLYKKILKGTVIMADIKEEKEQYELESKDLVIDIFNHADNNGISVYNVDMADNIKKFQELSCCNDNEILRLYKIAADRAGQYFEGSLYIDDKIAIISDYEAACDFWDNYISEKQLEVNDLELDERSNGKVHAYFIKYKAEKEGIRARACWNVMVKDLLDLKKNNVEKFEAINTVLKSRAGIIYCAMVKETHHTCEHKDMNIIVNELSDMWFEDSYAERLREALLNDAYKYE